MLSDYQGHYTALLSDVEAILQRLSLEVPKENLSVLVDTMDNPDEADSYGLEAGQLLVFVKVITVDNFKSPYDLGDLYVITDVTDRPTIFLRTEHIYDCSFTCEEIPFWKLEPPPPEGFSPFFYL